MHHFFVRFPGGNTLHIKKTFFFAVCFGKSAATTGFIQVLLKANVV
jgi:hypothetical protein